MADKLDNGLFISEILPDNAGGGAFDTDGDGGGNHSDEFVEIQNKSSGTISLDGIEIWSEKNGLLYAFGSADTIAAGETATLVGQYDGAEPAGFYDAGLNEGARLLPDGEGNKWDSVFLYDSNTNTYVVLSYGNPPRTPSLPTGFPAGTTQIGLGESIDSNGPNGRAFSRDSNGNLIETNPDPGTTNVVCFLQGTEIDTIRGPIAVESLKPGDVIITKSGPKPLRAIGSIHVTREALKRLPGLRPVLFKTGAIGNRRPIGTSPNHRVVVGGATLERYFGFDEAFVPAKTMVNQTGISHKDDDQDVTYFHLLFEAHEVISLGGAWMESLYLSDISMNAVTSMKRAGNWTGVVPLDFNHSQTALPDLKTFEAKILLEGMATQQFANIELVT